MLKNKISNEDNQDLEKAKRPIVKLSKIDSTTKWSIVSSSILILMTLLVLVGFITYKSIPVFRNFGFFKFIFSTNWRPGIDDDKNASYGILGTIGSTLMLLVISLIIAVPLTIFGSLFICEYLGPRSKRSAKLLIQLLAGIPSVVFGLFAIDQIGKMFMLCGASSPGNMMTAALTLAFMALPTMMSLSIDAIESVPDGYRFSSLGLGVTKEKTTFNIVLKSALPKIITAIIIGMARIIGETMAVIMIAGGSSAGLNTGHGFSGFIFSSITTLAGTIGLEMLENSGTTHESALYAIGFILFFIVIIINLLMLAFSRRRKYKKQTKKYEIKVLDEEQKKNSQMSYKLKVLVRDYTKKRTAQTIESVFLRTLMFLATLIIIGFIFWIMLVILIKGAMAFSWGSFVTISGNKSGILATILVTALLIVATLTFATPMALIVAIYLSEYASKKSASTKIIRFAINIMSSTPSIVFGVFGLSLFIVIFHIPMSILASSFTMTLVVLPSLIIVFEDSLIAVPESYKEAAYGMGLGRTAAMLKVTLPSALKGMTTGVIMTVARIVGESAPIYLTLGTAVRLPAEGFLSSGATMTTEIYVLVSEGSSSRATSDAYMISLVAMVIIALLNYLSFYLAKRFSTGYNKLSVKERWREFSQKFSRQNISFFWRGVWLPFAKLWVKIKTIFNLKRWGRYMREHKANNREIKTILKEINYGRNRHANSKTK